jgi:hypothetical protein
VVGRSVYAQGIVYILFMLFLYYFYVIFNLFYDIIGAVSYFSKVKDDTLFVCVCVCVCV